MEAAVVISDSVADGQTKQDNAAVAVRRPEMKMLKCGLSEAVTPANYIILVECEVMTICCCQITDTIQPSNTSHVTVRLDSRNGTTAVSRATH